ncbi:MAG: redoxin family protein [Myxococcota bacterium]|nr:redoxin family protein [Myxococcota bacterium]
MQLRAALFIIAIAACSKAKDKPAVEEPAPVVTASAETASAETAPATTTPAAPARMAKGTINTIVGSPAPDFTLKDLEGKEVSLASFKGKTVVLEWFNPGCPFVKKAHGAGSLVDTAQRHAASGVVWLAINSGGPGKQGNEVKLNVDSAKTWKMAHPILRDESGTVGKAYGATNTPHIFVINSTGTVVYGGAIDNSPDGEKQSAADGKLVNYVDEVLSAIAAGTPIKTHDTKAYGCSVKYGS